MKNVNSKDTKGVIWDALQEALGKIKELESKKLDPVKEVTAKKKEETLTQANATVQTSIDNIVAQLQKQVDSALGNVSELIFNKTEDYKNLDEAIKIKKAEIEELFNIETSCYTLAALINTQDTMKQEFQEEMKVRKASAESELQDVMAIIRQTKNDWNIELTKMNFKRDEDRKREEDEYLYSLKRSRKIKEDKFEDEMAQKKKENELEIERMKEEALKENEILTRREAAILERESKMEELETIVANFPAVKEEAIAKAVVEVNRKAEQSYGFKERYLKQQQESDKALFEVKIENLENTVAAQKENINDLTAKLNAAYSEIKDMATKTVEGASNSRAFTALQDAMKDKNSQK